MSGYPIQIITDYRAGKISRPQFIKQFSEWQKANTINFDCKGTADRSGTYITYRGIKAEIKNGVLCWKNNTAKNIFEFQRQVDYATNAELQAIKNACFYSYKRFEAARNADYDKREEYNSKQNYFCKQAEKWGALWN